VAFTNQRPFEHVHYCVVGLITFSHQPAHEKLVLVADHNRENQTRYRQVELEHQKVGLYGIQDNAFDADVGDRRIDLAGGQKPVQNPGGESDGQGQYAYPQKVLDAELDLVIPDEYCTPGLTEPPADCDYGQHVELDDCNVGHELNHAALVASTIGLR